MKFAIVTLLAVFSTGVCAAPAPIFMRAARCNIGGCVSSLAPSVISCATAAAKVGKNVAADTKCLVDAANEVGAFPTACGGCATELGIAGKVNAALNAVEGAASKAGNAIEGAAESVGDFVGGLF